MRCAVARPTRGGRGRLRRVPRRARRGARTAGADLPDARRGLNAIARDRGALGGRFLYPFPAWDAARADPEQACAARASRAAERRRARTAHPRTAARGDRGGRRARLPRAREAVRPDRLQRRVPAPGVPLRDAGASSSAPTRAREPYDADGAGADSRAATTSSTRSGATSPPTARRSGSSPGASSGRRRPASARAGSARRSGSTRSSSRGSRFCAALGFHGISQVEFKRDPRDGRYKLMEINPRLWQWHGLAAACGVDLPRIAYCDLLGAAAARR